MGKVKKAHSGNYVIYQEESGSIKVWKNHDNQKAALREACAVAGFEFDSTWTTRQLGHKLINHIRPNSDCAFIGEYFIWEKKDGSIDVSLWYDNVKAALREVSETVSFNVDPEWTTRQLGSKLIDFLNK